MPNATMPFASGSHNLHMKRYRAWQQGHQLDRLLPHLSKPRRLSAKKLSAKAVTPDIGLRKLGTGTVSQDLILVQSRALARIVPAKRRLRRTADQMPDH
jgi:hypothetical protein